MAVRRVAIGAVVAAVVLAIVLALGWFRGGSGPAPAQPLSATAALATPALSFGDPLAARVEVLADPKQVDVGSLRVRPRFAPWRIVSETRERQSGAGTLLVYHWTLECLSQACLPGRTLAERRFLPALISYRSPTGRTVRRVVQWPTYRVVTRLTSPDIGDPTQHLAADTSLPPVTYRIAPGTLQALLAALAALLVVAAGRARLVRAAAAETGERSRTAAAPESAPTRPGEHVERLPGTSAPGTRPTGARAERRRAAGPRAGRGAPRLVVASTVPRGDI